MSQLFWGLRLFLSEHAPPPRKVARAMKEDSHTFLFHSLDGKFPKTARTVHIRRLFDVLHLSVQRGDVQRAKRIYSILLRCREVNWKDLWKMGLFLLAGSIDAREPAVHHRRIAFLRDMLLQHPDEVGELMKSPRSVALTFLIPGRLQRESIMQELILLLILTNREEEALDELEL